MNKNPLRQPEQRLINLRKLAGLLDKAGVGGICIAALTRLMGLPKGTVGNYLRTMRDEGKAERSNSGGMSCTWGPPGTWAHHEAHRARSADALAIRCARMERKRADEEAAEAFASAPVVRRIVPAGMAKPLRNLGPASVFEVADWGRKA